jgi:hypothetical protein
LAHICVMSLHIFQEISLSMVLLQILLYLSTLCS